MDYSPIPLHRLPDPGPVRVERIQPTAKPVKNSVHRHAYHELFLFQEGEGVHMIDMVQVPLRAPCIHLVAPGQVHKLDRSAGTVGHVLMFTPDIQHPSFLDPRVRTLLRARSGARDHALGQEYLKDALAVVGMIEHEQRHDPDPAIMENLLGVVLLKCLKWCQSSMHAKEDTGDVVCRFLERVDQEYLTKKQVAAYAADLALSPGHLNELVKKRIGRSASEVIHDRVLLEAKRLLLHADLSVKEVSFALHMEDPAYFTRMFRKAVGTTPSEYREHIREKYKH